MADDYVMLIVADASGLTHAEDGRFLLQYDPDGARGFGLIVTTPDPAQAKTFATQMDGFALWKLESRVLPLRDDGRPNRPLTAYTITMMERAEAIRAYARATTEKGARDAG